MEYKLGSYRDYSASVSNVAQQIQQNIGKSGSTTICCVALFLLFQAWMLFGWADKINSTNVLAVLRVFHALGSPDGKHVVAVFFMFAADLSILGALANLGSVRLLTFLPQVFLLSIMAGGGIWATFSQHYLDGTPVPWQHLIVDQSIYILVAFIHIFASLRRSRVR